MSYGEARIGCFNNYGSNNDPDLSSKYAVVPLNTAREFINSNHPLMEEFKEKIALMEFGPKPYPPREGALSPSYEKSASEASRLRKLGNEFYRLGADEEALKYYSQSIATATIDSEELALAFGNRSAVLMRGKRYDLCLLDINRALALKGKISKSSKQRLLNRKQESWTRLQKRNSRYLRTKEVSGTPTHLNTIENGHTVDSDTKESTKQLDESDLIIDHSLFDDEIWSTKIDDNALLPDASSKIKLENGTRRGQKCAIIATDDIAPGEVLLVQESHSVITVEDRQYDFCAYCIMWCEALIPCFTCSWEMYCSESCRQKAYDSYHRTECKILRLCSKIVPERRIPYMMLSLRMFLTGTGQNSSRLAKLMDDPNVYAIMDKKFDVVGVPYISNDYLAVLNSLWRIYDDVHLIPRAGMLFNDLIFLLYALRGLKFFDGQGFVSTDCGSNGFCSNEGELFTAFLLLQHMRLGVSHLAAISCVILHGGHDEDWTQNRVKVVGRHLGSFEAFINHSCDANAEVIRDGRRRLIYSLRPIRAGEQIFITHGGSDYRAIPLEKRREQLADFLECTCKACVEAWPVHKVLSKRKNKYLTSNKKIIKRIEKERKWFSALIGPANELGAYGLDDNMLQKAFDFNKTIRECVKEPSATITSCETVIQVRMMLKGSFHVVPLVNETSETSSSSDEVYL